MLFTLIYNDKPVDFHLTQAQANLKLKIGRSVMPEGKWRIQKQEVEGTDWYKREEEKFKSGKLRPPLWAHTAWAKKLEEKYHHFVAINGEALTYFPSNSHGVHDQRSTINVNQYLTEFSGLKPDAIRKWVETHFLEVGEYSYIITNKPREIVDLYRRAAPACMSHPADKYPCNGRHPVEAYGEGSDFSLFVLKKGDRYVGRTLIVEKDKVYMRTYGDHNKLQLILNKLGYKSKPPYGYKIKAIKLNNKKRMIVERMNQQSIASSEYMTPYVDNAHWMELDQDRKHFTVLRGNSPEENKTFYMCRTPGGLAVPARRCYKCKGLSNQFYTVNGRAYARCEHCREDGYLQYCRWSQSYYDERVRFLRSYGGGEYHPDTSMSWFRCRECGKPRRPIHMFNEDLCIMHEPDTFKQRCKDKKGLALHQRLFGQAPEKKKHLKKEVYTFKVEWVEPEPPDV